jgi:hypothetical protein
MHSELVPTDFEEMLDSLTQMEINLFIENLLASITKNFTPPKLVLLDKILMTS